MSNSRQVRGRETERVVAEHWRANGWPYAEAVGSGTPGRDLTGTPGIAPEIKARRGFDPLGWVRQAVRNARPGDVPCVILRPDGAGPASVALWPVVVPHDAFLALLAAAGYGNGPAGLTDALSGPVDGS